jgi:hypothetical protein
MRPGILHEFEQGNKTATVYTRGKDGFRVVLYDIYTEISVETYFTNETQAEEFAEDWVLQ